jgi:hypothetical protein
MYSEAYVIPLGFSKVPLCLHKSTFAVHSNKKSNFFKIDELKTQVSNAGLSGLLAYGILNCLYYTTATTIVWTASTRDIATKFIKSDSLLKIFSITTTYLLKVCGVVWAGSQLTKAFRLTGALLLAPLCEKLIDKCQKKFSFKSRQKVVGLLASLLLSTSIIYYGFLLVSTTFFYWMKLA